jgi:hypothetical protein
MNPGYKHMMCSGSRWPKNMNIDWACQKLSIGSVQYDTSSVIKPCATVVHHSHM